MEQQPKALVCDLEVLPVTGTKCMCVKCLTPSKPPAPNQRAQWGEGRHVKVIVTSFLAKSWGKEIKVSEVLGQFEVGGKRERKKKTKA